MNGMGRVGGGGIGRKYYIKKFDKIFNVFEKFLSQKLRKNFKFVT